MVIAVVTVRVVQMAIDQVINMIAMWHGLMAAAWAVHMTGGVAGALMAWRAALGVVSVDRQAVLIDMIVMHMVQVAIVQVINVTIVLNRRMAASSLVLMAMVGVLRASTHVQRLFRLLPSLQG